MPEPIDRESYLKGHEDAMRVVGMGETAPGASPPEPPYGVPLEVPESPPARKGPGWGQKLAKGIGNKMGEALGFLVVFPLLVGLVVTGVYLLGGSTSGYETAFVAGAGFGFLFGLFVLVVRWGFQLFVNFWPIILVIVGIVIAWKALT
jgi:hypothetical protein